MNETRDRGRIGSAWRRGPGSRLPVELGLLLILGAVAFLLFRWAPALSPVEGALLVVATAGLLGTALHWWVWNQRLIQDGALVDWIQQVLQGERSIRRLPEGLSSQDRRTLKALNRVIENLLQERSELADLRTAMARDWQELDALLAALQGQHEAEMDLRRSGAARLKSLGQGLKAVLEDTLKLDQVELGHRLRSDQHRLQEQAFRNTLEQMQAGLEHFENLLGELQDTFPRLRREEDALRRLADAGLRQGARLNLSVKGLVAHTSRLVEDAQARAEWLGRLRRSADGVRDRTESLARRTEGFRDEAQARIRSFNSAQGPLRELDQVAQQAGLLAVNAAILAQQESGSTGLAAIGERLRVLADQTTESATGMERILGDYRQGLERESAGLWDLQEVTQRLLTDVHELLRTAGHLDLHGQDLERALETHLGLVDQAHQTSERAELSLLEIGARALALESAHGRQWSVEAKLAPEQERLSRVSRRLAEVGEGLAHLSQQNLDEILEIQDRYQEVRRTEAYRQVASGDLPLLVEGPDGSLAAWNAIAWARAERRSRLEQRGGSPLPMGHLDSGGRLHLWLLGQDALSRPEASALDSWTCDPTAQTWELGFPASLRTEGHRLALLALVKQSRIASAFPALDLRITPEGVRIRLPHPYPRLPEFLAGLRLELAVEPSLWDHPFRPIQPRKVAVQGLLWLGPSQGGGLEHPWTRLAHAWAGHGRAHESFLPELAYGGQRPPCPWPEDDALAPVPSDPMPVRCFGLGADPAPLHPFLRRLVQAGATEGPGGLALCAIGISHPHPEALLLGLFQADADLAGAFHPDLIPYQVRLRDEVLAGSTGDPYRAGWSLLEDLQREGWLLPLPESAGQAPLPR